MSESEKPGEVTPLFDVDKQKAELIQRRIEAQQEIGRTSIILNSAQKAYNMAIIKCIETTGQLRELGVDTHELETKLHQPKEEPEYDREIS